MVFMFFKVILLSFVVDGVLSVFFRFFLLFLMEDFCLKMDYVGSIYYKYFCQDCKLFFDIGNNNSVGYLLNINYYIVIKLYMSMWQ